MQAFPRRITTGLFAAVLLVTSPIAAAGQELTEPAEPLAHERLNVTTLAVVPSIEYETASLRVAGPNGYRLTKTFEAGAPISADLQTEVAPRVGALAAAGATASGPVIASTTLQNGQYRYEAVFKDGDEDSTVHSGAFFADEGKLVSREAKRAELGSVRESLARAAREDLPPANGGGGTYVPEYLAVIDFDHDDNTFLGLTNLGPAYTDWAVANLSGNLIVAKTYPDIVYGMTIAPTGRLGIGTLGPGADLDVNNADGDDRTNIRFAVSGHSWTNAIPSSSGNFIFNRQGTGGPEFVVTERFAPSGTLVVNGTVNETSSRVFKTGFAAVDPIDLLTKLVALPVTTWSYKGDRTGGIHIGPVAEDFQRLLGFGDGQSIASTDARGVMMAAIQGLKQLVDAKDAEIAALETRLAALEARVSPASP